MDKINSLTGEWKNAKISALRDILSKNKINKTGRLSKSYKIKLIQQGDKQSIDFYSMFYGKYVRAHYLKQGFDIWEPLSDVRSLIKKLSVDFKKQVVEEIVTGFNTKK